MDAGPGLHGRPGPRGQLPLGASRHPAEGAEPAGQGGLSWGEPLRPPRGARLTGCRHWPAEGAPGAGRLGDPQDAPLWLTGELDAGWSSCEHEEKHLSTWLPMESCIGQCMNTNGIMHWSVHGH